MYPFFYNLVRWMQSDEAIFIVIFVDLSELILYHLIGDTLSQFAAIEGHVVACRSEFDEVELSSSLQMAPPLASPTFYTCILREWFSIHDGKRVLIQL